MITAIQALPNIDAVPALAANPPSARQANPLPIVPSVTLSLGTTPTPALTYTASGVSTVLVQQAAIALSNSLFVNSVAQARANVEGNPAYASAVAGLYMSAAIFQAQQAIALASTADSVQPIAATPAVGAVKAV